MEVTGKERAEHGKHGATPEEPEKRKNGRKRKGQLRLLDTSGAAIAYGATTTK
jgi:hypothetical protein